MSNPPIESTAGYLLVQVARAHRSRMAEALRELELYVGQEMVLKELWKREGLMPSELASDCNLEPPTVTTMLRRMAKADLVRMKPDPDDARVRRVYLTDRGVSLREDVQARWSAVEERLLRGFDGEDRKTLRGFLARMLSNMSE